LSDGIGDTVRVSLTEDSVHEIPVAEALVGPYNRRTQGSSAAVRSDQGLSFDPFNYERRSTAKLNVSGTPVGDEETIRVFVRQKTMDSIVHKLARMGDFQPEGISDSDFVTAIDPTDAGAIGAINSSPEPRFVTIKDNAHLPVITAYRLLASALDARHPILLKDTFQPSIDPQRDFLQTLLQSATNIGALLCDGIGDAILIQGEEAPGQSLRLAYNILQAAGSRIFKTDYVACPSCGRTLFDLQKTTARIRNATNHLKGVKIAIMGCIVNGPGEMADADFGYVGGAPGKVNLYVGKKAVKFNIPEHEAVDRLVDLVREHGRWVDAAPASQGEQHQTALSLS
jgi:(E)-4-hydroxy-3-methylbut-2-enyl-diphosphate synthase